MKRAITYKRFSSDGQSSFSIERQTAIIDHWSKYNQVQIIDSFNDEGYTARTFDRPDVKELFSFIKKNYSQIDFLLVAELTRFSRETGDAINMVKKIQSEYNIKIVSCNRSMIYDCTDSNSFFMMGLEFLLGNSENIKRQSDINGGIYTAKAVKGKWIQGGPAPFGYKKDGAGDQRRLIVNNDQANVVKFIYDAFLHNTPYYIILQDIKEMGFPLRGKSAINLILKNPIYIAQQYVKPYKELPGGLFPGKWDPIVDSITWNRVQDKINGKSKTRVSVADEVPLRGVLHCHCGKLVTAAPSRGGSGKYFYYYKCQHKQHNNISAIKAHEQLNETLGYMSLPDRLINAIKIKSDAVLEDKQKENKKLLQFKTKEMDAAIEQMQSLEEKWINNQVSFETYNRWHSTITQKRNLLSAEVKKLSLDHDQFYIVLHKNIDNLGDLQYVYKRATTLQKQELLRKVFDNQLYYQNKVYRTKYVMPIFTHNLLILNNKRLLIVDGMEEGTDQNSYHVEVKGLLSNSLLDFLYLIQSLQAA